MFFPKLQELDVRREMTTMFGGYNHQISCQEGQFFDMKNMTAKYYPTMSPRVQRGVLNQLTNPQGIIDKEDIWLIDDKKLYRNGNKVNLVGVELTDESPKLLEKMGAYIVIFPDKVWVKTNTENINLECGYMENKVNVPQISFSTCDASGNDITWHDAQYYKDNPASDGDYMMSTNSNGEPSLKVYSASTSIWMTVSSTYCKVSGTGIGVGFDKDDGVKITMNTTSEDAISALKNILVNKENDETYYTNTYIVNVSDDAITIPGIYKATSESGTDTFDVTEFKAERNVPDMSFVVESNNRLWGCSKDGHEVYCCKLGDVKNWNSFRGVSLDSWSATIGSDGKFTGAVNYLGNPLFFKEDCFIKISISSVGGHGIKETKCRGVQEGSGRSLSVLNEVLYYKSRYGVCGYTGGLPFSLSDELGDIQYYDAVAGSVGDCYYISMRDKTNKYSLFVYDTKNRMWLKEDFTNVFAFCRHDGDLYYINRNNNTLYSVGGSFLPYVSEKEQEKSVDWFVESGEIGYLTPDNKYISRINIRISLDFGTNVDLYVQYDSSGRWEHQFNMSGQGTRHYAVPIVPHRCDHFKYKIVGKGNCKIHALTKTIEEGSD